MFTATQEEEVKHVIKSAGAKLLEYWPGGKNPKTLGDRKKSDGSIVTDADFAANDILIDGLQKIFLEDGFYSEEGTGLTDPDAEAVWIIDPLDGTKYFSMGTEDFAILVARSVKGIGEYGICYFPVQDIYVVGQRGDKTTSNGNKLTVSNKKSFGAQSIYVKNTTIEKEELLCEYDGHGAFMVEKLCAGGLEGIILKLSSHQEWDLAPYMPIIEAAGGKVTDERGDLLSFHYDQPTFRYVVASNGILHDELLKLVL